MKRHELWSEVNPDLNPSLLTIKITFNTFVPEIAHLNKEKGP